MRHWCGIHCTRDPRYDLRFCDRRVEPDALRVGEGAGAENSMVARQIAIVDQGKAGFSAIAVSVKAPDGTRKSAEKLLTTLARWLHNNKIVPAGRCP